jgi:hypothetical protein
MVSSPPPRQKRLVDSEIRVCTHTHENWQILICPRSENCQWEFRCLPPDSDEPLHDGRAYCCRNDALSAAKSFINKQILWSQVSTPLDQWIEEGRISVDEKNRVLEPVVELLSLLG